MNKFFMFMVIFCNTFDSFYTSYFISIGTVKEANPIMNYVIEHFYLIGLMTIKVILVNLIILFLYAKIKNKLAKYGLFLVGVVYFMLVVYELYLLGG